MFLYVKTVFLPIVLNMAVLILCDLAIYYAAKSP